MTECYLTPAAPDLLCRCDNCGHECLAAEVGLISDIDERLDPGGLVPAGECPECGCLTYYANGPDGTYQASAEADRRKVATLLSHVRAIRARIKGEWDNPDLLAMGPLFTSGTDDVLRFAEAAIAAAEGNAPAPEPEFVYVLTIDTRHGAITWAFKTREAAESELAKWCREYWTHEEDNSAMEDHEVIEAFFHENEDEFANIERIQVGG